MLERAAAFLEQASFLNLPGAAAWISAGALGIVGLVGLTRGAPACFAPDQDTGSRLPPLAVALLVAGWAAATALPYVATSPTFRAYDYACAENNRNPNTSSDKTLTLGPEG